tara:strand:- start:232 stop:843 length:612 start_codon:yes stop_codon:yes gene_type:complete
MTWSSASYYNKNRKLGITIRDYPNGDDPKKKELFGETKKCTTCKEIKDVFKFHWKNYNKKGKFIYRLQGQCGECRKKQKEKKYSSDPHSYVYRKLQQIIQESATQRKSRKPCSLSLVDFLNIWQAQYEKTKLICPVSGEQMTFTAGQGKIYTNISVDRIDSSKNYEYGNVIFVCLMVNLMKGDMSYEGLNLWCKKIIERGYNE